MKYFPQPFSLFCGFKKGTCWFLQSYVHLVLFNFLEGLSLPNVSRLTDRINMIIIGWLGHKPQYNNLLKRAQQGMGFYKYVYMDN